MLKNITFNLPIIRPDFANSSSGFTRLIGSELSYCGCNFSWQHFRQSCFNRYGIQQPLELKDTSAKRQCEFIAGRTCASQALKNLYRIPATAGEIQIPIQSDRSPRWPTGVVGSISHSEGWAMAVTGRSHSLAALGIDCEVVLTDQAAGEIADLVLHPRDRKFLSDQLTIGTLVTLAFSAKESLFKALNTKVLNSKTLLPPSANIKSFHDFTIYSISDHKIILRPSKRLNDSWATTTEFSIDYVKQSAHIVTMAVIAKSAIHRQK